ncbi:MAG: enolase C-terminal domain-like protein [Acidimicrobiales bacterium]
MAGMRPMWVEMATFPTSFTVAVRHASAVRATTENIIVRVRAACGAVGVGEGCPRRYVTGETVESARAFLRGAALGAATAADTVEGLRSWMADHQESIDAHPAAFCALELALLDALARQHGVSVERLLGRPGLSGTFRYTAVIGDSGHWIFALLLQRYLALGIHDFKLKLSGDRARDRSKLARLRRRGANVRVRVDANNLWSDADACIEHLERLDFRFTAIEEPLTVNDLDGFARIAAALDTPIVIDESGLRGEQLDHLPGPANRWILNCRVSKMGGLLRSLAAVEAARGFGLGVIVGAHVGETSILTRAALTVAADAGNALVAREGAFGTKLLRRDLVSPVLMFGRGAELDIAGMLDPASPGLGLLADESALADREVLVG